MRLRACQPRPCSCLSSLQPQLLCLLAHAATTPAQPGHVPPSPRRLGAAAHSYACTLRGRPSACPARAAPCAQLDKLYVIKFGEVQLLRDDALVEGGDASFVQEAGGFTFFGADALQGPVKSKYTVKVGQAALPLPAWGRGWGALLHARGA